MSPSLLLRWGLRHHAWHPLRTALWVLGIALGVALWVGIQSALGSATTAFATAAATFTGAATHVVRGGPDGVPTAVLGELWRTRGVVAVAPVTEGRVRLRLGSSAGVRYFGCDPLSEGAIGRAFAVGGGAGAAQAGLQLLAAPGAFVATAATLARLHVAVGETVALEEQAASCVGTIPPAGGALEDVLVVDIATAQEWSGRPDRVDRIDLRLDGDGTATVARLERALGAELRVEAARGHAGFAEMTAAFRTNLEALGLMALLVGAFLVHAAMRGAVAGRQVEFALLRALGASARRLALAILREALVLGLVGSVVGCGLGVMAARVLVDPLVRTLNDHYASFSLPGVTIDPWVLAAAVALGTIVAVAAALAPAREASEAPPRAVFVSSRLPQVGHDLGWWLVPALASGGGALLWLAGRQVELAHAGLLLLMLAAASATPRLVELALHGAARALSQAGPWWVHVARGAATSRARTGSATAALVLAVAMTLGLGTLIASFRASVTAWLEQALPADVYCGVNGRFEECQGLVLAADTVAAIEAVPGIAAMSRYRRCLLDVTVAGRAPMATEVAIVAPSARVLEHLPLLGDAMRARARFAAGEGALASEPLAFQRGLQVGDAVVVATGAGRRSVAIVGVVRDYRSAGGELVLPARWYGPTAWSSLAIEAAAGVDVDELVQQVRERAQNGGRWVAVDSHASIRRGSLSVFDRTFAITAALRLLCIGVAVLGIYGAFRTLQQERTAEIGLLRALGAGPRQVAVLVLGQTSLLGLCAGLLAVPVGYGMGLVLVHSINRGSFGWSMLEVVLPLRNAGEAVGLAVGAAFLAGLEPALRMVRTAPAVALREG